jgi:hypothetical protein
VAVSGDCDEPTTRRSADNASAKQLADNAAKPQTTRGVRRADTSVSTTDQNQDQVAAAGDRQRFLAADKSQWGRTFVFHRDASD